jgi:nitrite reductase (NADH) small subunit
VTIEGEDVAVFNLGDRFLAVDNACPHRGGPLCDGIVSGEMVICPLHNYKISLETGEVKKPDVPVRVQTYETRVENGVLMIAVEMEQEIAA